MSKLKHQKNPADIAREAFQQLAARRVAPTPDAYRNVYEEIAGGKANISAETVLAGFATTLLRMPGEAGRLGQRLAHSADDSDFVLYNTQLSEFVNQFMQPGNISAYGNLAPDNEPQFASDNKKEGVMRDLLSRVLNFNLASLLQDAPELALESRAIGDQFKEAFSESAMDEVATRLKRLTFQIELKTGDIAQQHELLMRLFRLLLENIHGLLDKDSWLSGQITAVQNLISGPISQESLAEATKTLKEIIYKQGLLKETIEDEKITVKNLMLTFVDRLSGIVSSTSNYHDTITGLSKKVSKAGSIGDLNSVLNDIMLATKSAQEDAKKSRDDMIDARQEAQKSEIRIHDLEVKLQQMGNLVREDPLTGSLNRRGLDDSFEREIANADRRNTPLCIALLDLDDFKRLNDTHGHNTGDGVLIHLVQVVKDTLRKLDVVARFGGEEFLILLPETTPAEAMMTVTRVQRELTRRIFMHNYEQLLITFSAGVALRKPGEQQIEMIKRADDALYKAKKAGKNRVVMAE
ncbi:GGDEF domain-containing protein [Herbaspirillum sp. RTI4]|uniref:GGDEF domain-containing protein n=1 Tax=Herbaspirillum sp. RTI4 TaxID=3048640 RepID=UPI002AB521FE|nr:GGDEF domain-containing protein [Herbaspirillum sp. RTI4]MDY7579179.1 GGDEF domain-containing protein [Herbaspirillum sp. RTI4]MEA9983227.1 GGDEF domain-containing protein [Herbaspirillum sp. RTI4]